MSDPPDDDGVPPDSASNPSIAPFFGTPGQLHTHKQWTDLLLPFFLLSFRLFPSRTFLHPGPLAGRNGPTGKPTTPVTFFASTTNARTHECRHTGSTGHEKASDKIAYTVRGPKAGSSQYGVPRRRHNFGSSSGWRNTTHAHTRAISKRTCQI